MYESMYDLYHTTIYASNFRKLFKKIEKLDFENIVKLFIYKNVDDFFTNESIEIINKINLVENKPTLDFCCIFIDIFQKHFQNIPFMNFSKNYITGFFINEYQDTYEKFVNKLRELQENDKKNELYKLLLINFFIESVFPIIYETISNIMNKIGINIKNVNTYFEENYNNNLGLIIKDLETIDETMDILDNHYKEIANL